MRLRAHLLACAAPTLLAITGASPAVAQIAFGGEAGGVRGMQITSFRDIPFKYVVRQQYDYSCGSAALATLLRFHYGIAATEAEMFKTMYEAGDKKLIQRAGFSLLDMKTYLDARGMTADGFKLNWRELETLDRPSIAMIETGSYRHFVVIKGVRDGHVLIGDPSTGLAILSRQEFEQQWTGITFFVVANLKKSPLYNNRTEWTDRSQTPWNEAIASTTIPFGLSREGAPQYQFSNITNLGEIR